MGHEPYGKKAIVALREPSLGPCFGMKGGAAGGGYAQVVPWKTSICTLQEIFMPLQQPTTMISALLENLLYQNQNKGKCLREIVWKRVLDVNDRTLRA
jgi:formate--tetrahydrofolate ligase